MTDAAAAAGAGRQIPLRLIYGPLVGGDSRSRQQSEESNFCISVRARGWIHCSTAKTFCDSVLT